VLTHMEPNQRALSLVFEWQLDSMPVPVFRHYPAWYSAIKKGVVDMSFAMCYPQIVVYKPSKMPALPIDFELHPQTFTWASTDAGIYRYFVVRAPVDIGPRLFFDAPCRIRLAAQKGSWWLYERDSRCTALGAP
jgi:hypothetical protein